MKLLTVAFLALSATTAFAGQSSLEQEVANDIQALVSDTVNEGSQDAQVIYEGDTPSVECKVSNAKDRIGVKWAFCRVDFRVTFEDLEDVAERQCKLLYSFDPAQVAKTLERANEDLIQDCMETLSEGP